MTISDTLTMLGAAYSAGQVLHLPSRLPYAIDIRRLLLTGWITIETPGYIATAKVHYKVCFHGISGTRVHQIYIWRDQGQTEMRTNTASYRHVCGHVFDELDGEGKEFLNQILEYFR